MPLRKDAGRRGECRGTADFCTVGPPSSTLGRSTDDDLDLLSGGFLQVIEEKLD